MAYIPPIDLPPGATPWNDPERAAALKTWFAAELRLDDDAVVYVSESVCSDPSCPVVETAVVVFEEARTRKWQFARPRYAVTRLMVRQAVEANPDGSRKGE